MKKRAVILLSLLLLLIVPMVFAQSIFDPLDDIFLDVIPNDDLSRPNVRENPALWIFATFTLVYAIFYAATAQIPLFRDQSGSRAALAIVFGVLSVIIPGVIGLLSALGPIIIFVLVLFGLIFIGAQAFRDLKTGVTEAGVRGLAASKEREALQHEIKKERSEFKREKRTLKREETAMKKLRGLSRYLTAETGKEKEMLQTVKRRITQALDALGRHDTEEAREAAGNAMKSLAGVIQTVNKAEARENKQAELERELQASELKEYADIPNIENDLRNEDKILEHIGINEKRLTGNLDLFEDEMKRDEKKIKKAKEEFGGAKNRLQAFIHTMKLRIQKTRELDAKVRELYALEGEFNRRIGLLKSQMLSGNINSIELGIIDQAINDLDRINKLEAEIMKIEYEIDVYVLDSEKTLRKEIDLAMEAGGY